MTPAESPQDQVMNARAQAGDAPAPRPWNRAGDVWGGLAAMVVALPSSIAFGVLVYSTLGPGYAAQGAVAGIVGAAAIGLTAPLLGGAPRLISAPCAPAAAVLSALALALLQGPDGRGALVPERILPLLTLTAVLSGLLQLAYGAIGGGRLIKYIPYPVVSGYLSGVAVLIALAQLPKLLGLAPGTALARGLLAPEAWRWQGLTVGLVTIAAVGFAPRLSRRIPATILGLAGGGLAYFVLALFDRDLLRLEGNALVIGRITASGASVFAALPARASALLGVGAAELRLILIPALTLSVLLSIDTLKTCVVLDALTRGRHDSNRELLGQAAGNLVSAVVGGMPGAGTMGPTLVNVTSGGASRWSGVIEGVLTLCASVLVGGLVAWIPIGALAGILLVVAWRMFDRSSLNLVRHASTRLDFLVVAVVIVVAATTDLIAASGVGIALAILLFIRDQIRGSVIRRKLYVNQVSSKNSRLPAERAVLDAQGDQAVVCQLQGNLFFGTTDQLLSELEPDLRVRRYVVLDLGRVQSMDFTAAHLLDRIQSELAGRDGKLILCDLPPDLPTRQHIQGYLDEVGLGRASNVLTLGTTDDALEWVEDRILEEAGHEGRGEERPLELREIDLLREFDAEMLGVLASCVFEASYPAGTRILRQHAAGDEMFLIRRGAVRIQTPLEGDRHLHLATIGRGDFFGEIAFLDRGVRSADAVATAPTDVYVLARGRFDETARTHPVLAVRVFARLARVLAHKLRTADGEIRALRDR